MGTTASSATRTVSYDDSESDRERARRFRGGTLAARLATSLEGTHTYDRRGTLRAVDTGSSVIDFDFDALSRLSDYDGVVTYAYDGVVTYAYDSLDRIATRNATAFVYAGESHDPSSDGSFSFSRSPSVSDTATYEPFGEVIERTGSVNPNLGYQGDFTDPASEQVWMGARWYAPNWASFTSRDTLSGELETPVSINRYTYAQGDPLEYFDPDGRFACRRGSLCDRITRDETPKDNKPKDKDRPRGDKDDEKKPNKPDPASKRGDDSKQGQDEKARNRNNDLPRSGDPIAYARAKELRDLAQRQQQLRERARELKAARERARSDLDDVDFERVNRELRQIEQEFRGNKDAIDDVLDEAASGGHAPSDEQLEVALDSETLRDIRGSDSGDRGPANLGSAVRGGPEVVRSHRGDDRPSIVEQVLTKEGIDDAVGGLQQGAALCASTVLSPDSFPPAKTGVENIGPCAFGFFVSPFLPESG